MQLDLFRHQRFLAFNPNVLPEFFRSVTHPDQIPASCEAKSQPALQPSIPSRAPIPDSQHQPVHLLRVCKHPVASSFLPASCPPLGTKKEVHSLPNQRIPSRVRFFFSRILLLQSSALLPAAVSSDASILCSSRSAPDLFHDRLLPVDPAASLPDSKRHSRPAIRPPPASNPAPKEGKSNDPASVKETPASQMTCNPSISSTPVIFVASFLFRMRSRTIRLLPAKIPSILTLGG